MKRINNKLINLGNFLFDNRYKIALIIFVLCIIFKINGSSIGLWNSIVNTGISDKLNILIGKSRSIRSDEFAVLTPMFIGQTQNGFKYFNDIFRATNTDVFMIYAMPVASIFQLYRPFLLGFLIFGAARGLSFFWCGRFIALFLASLELCMILTKKNKLLSYIGAIMITLSPIIQWWFAVNGICEIFIFGELAIILLYKYLNTENFKKRIVYLFFLLICAGGYVLVIYPSWQIPMFYVFLILAIWIIIDNKGKIKISKKDILSIIITLMLFIISMLLIFNKSKETIKIVMNTVYPGARFETGGGTFKRIWTYISHVFLPYKGSGIIGNQSEAALMFGLFPIGIILTIKYFCSKNKDNLLIFLLFIYVFLGIWCFLGFPRWLAKITLLSNSQAGRSIITLGYLDILLLVRSLSLEKKSFHSFTAFILSLFMSSLLVILNSIYNASYLNTIMIIFLFIMTMFLFYFVLQYQKKWYKQLFVLGITFTMFLAGFFVNPIRRGIESVTNSDILKNVSKIDKKESGIWITEGLPYPVANYIIMSGVKTINVTNTYPDLEKWYKLDDSRKYKDIYNRYAHISIKLTDANSDLEKFELLNPDYFNLNIRPDDLLVLNVKYIFTDNDLEKYNTDNINFELIYKYSDYKIYKVSRGV